MFPPIVTPAIPSKADAARPSPCGNSIVQLKLIGACDAPVVHADSLTLTESSRGELTAKSTTLVSESVAVAGAELAFVMSIQALSVAPSQFVAVSVTL
jgi:hypothetical protein